MRASRLIRGPALPWLVVLALAVPVGPAGAVSATKGHSDADAQGDSGEGGFTIINGNCRETGAFLAVDSERLTPYLPDNFSDHFTVTDVGGKAVIGVVSIACSDVTVDGEDGLAWNTNEAIVVIDPPTVCAETHNACEGFHHYLLWGPMDNTRLAASYKGLGAVTRSFMPSHHNEVSINLGTPTNTADCALRGHYTLSTETVSASVFTPDRKQTEWQIGSRGLVADSFEVFAPEFWSAGQITIRPQPGSPLAGILGSHEPFTTGGFITQLHGIDTVQLLP